MENSCWQILLQSDALQDWADNEKMAIANLFNYSGSLEDIKISDIFQTPQEQITDFAAHFSSPIPTSKYVDKRIRAIKLYNFRLFPSPVIGEKPYGVDFTKNGKPCSLFLVGGNGTGKSSVYSALELHYTGFCSHAEEMRCSTTKYLTYGLSSLEGLTEENVSLGLFRQDNTNGNGEYEEFRQKLGEHQRLCPSSSFCSDYDTEQIKQNGKILYLYILRQLGYERFEQALNSISKMSKNLLEMQKSILQDPEQLSSADFNVVILNFLRSIGNGDEIVAECKQYLDPKEIKIKIRDRSANGHKPILFQEQWEIAEKSRNASLAVSNTGLIVQTPSIVNAEYESQVSLLASLYYELQKLLEQKKEMRDGGRYPDETTLLLSLVENMMKRKRDLENIEYRQIIDSNTLEDIHEKINILEKIKILVISVQNKIVFQFQQTFQNEISEVLESFSEYGETYNVIVSSNSFKIEIHVPTENGSFITNPFEYFNSFRFKLFCITLKICLSLYWMQRNKTIVPFVIDDVFNANDFNNGLKLQHFVYNIYKWYDQKVMRADGCDIPLQLIMLTHDDLMLSAFKKGFMYMSETDLIDHHYCKKSLDNLRCGRIFPYKAIGQETAKKNLDFINLYIDGEEFC